MAEEQIQQPPSKTQLLYNTVSKKYNVGTFEEFNKKLQNPEKRKAFYDGVGKEYNLGDYNEFEQKISPSVKKKESTDSQASPSGSTPIPQQTEQSIGTSASGLQKGKQIQKNYKNNSLTQNDIDSTSNGPADKKDWNGLTSAQIADLINNKGSNIKKASNAPIVVNIQKAVKDQQDLQKKMTELSTRQSMVGDVQDYDKQIQDLKGQESIVRSKIQKSYDAQKEKIVPELIDNLKENFGGANWNEVYDNNKIDENGISSPVAIDSPLKWDSETHKLTPKSVEYIARNVDRIMNKKRDDVVNAQVSGDLDKKERTFFDLTKSVVDELNKVPVRKEQDKFTQDYIAKNPQIKEAFSAIQKANEYFSKENVDAVKAKVNTERDKEFMKTGQRYYNADNGIFNQNQDYVSIAHKYAQRVHDGTMTDAVARKQIDAEVLQHPALKKIKDNYDNEIKKINERTQTQYQDYLIQGLRVNNPNLTVYKDGKVGITGLSEDQYTNMMEGYEEGMDVIAKKIGGEQIAASMKQSNQKAKNYGAFLGSLVESSNDLAAGFSKFIFNKTQWGGENVRNFEAKEIAAPSISQSDIASTWNWKGIESLKDPNFWMSKLGSMVPVIAGAAAVSAATEGEGIPQYVSWLANAGLFTAQGGLETYNQLLNTRDAQGNMLTEEDASHFMARDMERSILPNVLMMAATSGTLLKAKNIIKPTLLATAGKGLAGAAIAQPFFTWQGYESYANMQEAEGKKTDFWDYMQSKEFKDNLINGMVVGGGLSLLHAPGNYMKSVDNWTKMVHTSEGEFRNLIPQNYALQQEMSGNGNYLRDALKLHVFNTDPEGLNEAGKKQLADLKNQLLYSVNLDRNIQSANLDRTNVNDLYQAHNLALADQHDFMAEQNKDNKSLSSLYSDKAKEYREQAKAVANGEAKYHYLTNDQGEPIFMSDKSFRTLDENGTIGKWIIDQTIEGVHSSDDPEFAQRYKDHVEAKNESIVQGDDSGEYGRRLIEINKKKLGANADPAMKNPDEFYKSVADQAFGVTRDSEGNRIKSDLPDANYAVRELYGNDIVDLAKVMYPLEEKTESIGTKKEETGEAKKLEPAKIPQGEYKPNIRDDYFAQSDFFTPEEKEKFSKLSEADQDKMIDEKRAELSASPEDNIPVSEMIGKPVTYKGKKGILSQDGQSLVFKEEGTNKEYEIGNADKLGNTSAKELGIGTEKSVVDTDPEGAFTVRGKKYTNPFEDRGQDPTDAILYDKDGNIVNVRMKTPEGERRTFTGAVAEDLAYQIHLKEISKNNEQPALEEFINSDEPTREEIENGGFTETPEEKPVVNIEEVPGETVKKEEPVNKPEEEKSESKDAGDVPSPEPPKPKVVKESPKEEFTSVRKEKNREIEGAKELFEKQGKIKWSETYEKGLSNVQAMYPDKDLYEAAKSRINEFVAKLDSKILFNPTSEDNAVFNYFKNETIRKMGSIQGWDSTDNMMAQVAQVEFAGFNADLFNVVRVTNPEGEAGRAFNILQSEIANDPDHGLQIRRMDLRGYKKSRLSEADLEFTAAQWEKEKEILRKEQDLKMKSMEEKFDKKIEKLQKDIGKTLKEESPKTKREKQLSEKGKEWADKIRGAKFKKGDTLVTFPGVPQAVNAVLEGVAKLVEGGFTLAEAIDKYVTDNKIKNKNEFTKNLFTVIDKYEKREDAFDKIKEISESTMATDVTNDMVSKNLIRDYINSHVGLHDPKEVMDVALDNLKTILPNIEKGRLTEAYLKQGDFKQPTKKELENGFKESQQKFEKLTKLDKDINDLNEKKNLLKNGTSKSQSTFDKDIETKENERKKIMTEMGVKTASQDKYAKASYDQRAKSHNQRIDDLNDKIQQKIESGNLTNEQVKKLTKLKNQLDAIKVKLDPDSKLSQEKTLEGGIAALKGVLSEFNRSTEKDIINVGDVRRQLQKISDKFESDKEDSEQDIKLSRTKDKLARDAEEYKRKINAGEFEDQQPIILTKSDPELIKLERQKTALSQAYQEKKKQYEKQNKTGLKRWGDFLRGAEVTLLISAPMTLAKVAGSAVLRPLFETLTKMTAGKGYEKLPFITTKTISERAKLGGESTSLKAAVKGYEAFFRQYSANQLEKKYTLANDKYEAADHEYQMLKGEVNKLDTDDKGYKKAQSELQEIKNNRDNALVDAVGNIVYQYIAGSSLKEAGQVLLHRTAQIEKQFGQFESEKWEKLTKTANGKEKLNIALDNISYVMNFVGRSHSALKTFSGRYSFASGLMARLEGSVRDGVNIAEPDKLLQIAHESYLDWDRGKYQESNWLTDSWNKATNAVEKVFPIMGQLMKADVAITRVPVNMLYEGIVEYGVGALIGSVKSAREYYKAKGIVLNDGFTPERQEEFKTALREQLQKMDSKNAASIVRAFRKGGFGLGLYALAVLGHASFGGFYHKGQTAEDKKKKQREEETGQSQLLTGEIKIGDWKVPEPAAKILEHTPGLQGALFGLGIAQVYENNIKEGKSTVTSAKNDLMAHIDHITGSLPMIDKMILPLAAGAASGLKSKLPAVSGEWMDVDQNGNPVKRKAFNAKDYLDLLPFGDKKEILSDAYYKQALKTKKYYEGLISDIEYSNVTDEEKKRQREEYQKQMDEDVQEIYRQNKENPQ